MKWETYFFLTVICIGDLKNLLVTPKGLGWESLDYIIKAVKDLWKHYAQNSTPTRAAHRLIVIENMLNTFCSKAIVSRITRYTSQLYYIGRLAQYYNGWFIFANTKSYLYGTNENTRLKVFSCLPRKKNFRLPTAA